MKVTLYYCTPVSITSNVASICFLEPLPGHLRGDEPPPNDGNEYTTEVVNVPNGSKLVRSLDDKCLYLAVPKNGLFELLFANHVAACANENSDGFSKCEA